MNFHAGSSSSGKMDWVGRTETVKHHMIAVTRRYDRARGRYIIALSRYQITGYDGCTYMGVDFMKSSVVKHSIVIDGHKTSVSLEDAFWGNLKEIAHSQGATLSETVAEIDRTRQRSNLSSAIRLFVLDHVRTNRIGAAEAVGNDQTMTGVAPTAGRNVAG